MVGTSSEKVWGHFWDSLCKGEGTAIIQLGILFADLHSSDENRFAFNRLFKRKKRLRICSHFFYCFSHYGGEFLCRLRALIFTFHKTLTAAGRDPGKEKFFSCEFVYANFFTV